MITTDRFAFVHLHKSGGSFISEALLRFVPSAERVGYHYPQRMLPEPARGLPVLGTVRNPWDFYVSYYHFQKGMLDRRDQRNLAMSAEEMESFVAAGNDPLNGMDTLFLELSDRGELGFRETTRRLLLLDQDPAFEQVLEEMPTQLDRRGRETPIQVEGFRGMNVLRLDLEAARGAGLGLMSLLFRHMYGENPTAHFLRAEGLRQGLLDWLPTVGVGSDDALQRFILQGQRVNTSQRGRYAGYYDAELAQLVRERDGGIIERFGYTFGEDERTGR